MIIRELRGEDTEEYRALRLECLKLFPQSFGMSYDEFSSEPIEKTREMMEVDFHAKDKFLLGAFEENKLIGITHFARNVGKKYRHKGLITRVYVTPSEQGKGIAATLLDETIRRARLIPEMTMMQLQVAEENETAIRLYKSRGFQVYGIEPKAYKFEDGSFSSGNIFMFLELNH